MTAVPKAKEFMVSTFLVDLPLSLIHF